MKLTLQVLCIFGALLLYNLAASQTTILDFESEETSTTFQYFGSTLDGTFSETIDNPDPSGINESSTVLEFIKPAGAQTWAGAFSNPDPSVNVDFSANSKLCVKAWLPRPGNVTIKLENSLTGGADWITSAETSESESWVELCFEASDISIEAPFVSAVGQVYTRMVVFAYFGEAGGDEDLVLYLDDFETHPIELTSTVVLDFETDETSTDFQYFGSTLDGTTTEVIANPDPSGINTSDNVLSYVKPAGSEVWAGAFSNPNPQTPVDASQGGELCVKVWSPQPGNLAIKLEQSDTGDDWIITQDIPVGGEWVEICYNFSEASIEAPFTSALGHVYERIVIFFDFGTAGGDEDTNYFLDDMLVVSGQTSVANVTFQVDLSEQGDISSPVYLIGSFNNWSQDTPMNEVGNGVYQVDVMLDNGIYEYLYMIGDDITESMSPLDECVVVINDGEFVNRRIVVSGNAELEPVCFNSCYTCGNAVQITFNLGLGELEGDEGGVYIAGGQAFDPPGGRFRLIDDNGDGVYSISFTRGVGFTSFYTFTNGNCPDYSCKEDISGQDCANPNNFNDRLLEPVMSDIVINTCFGLCVDNVECTPTSVTEYLLEDFVLMPTIADSKVMLQRGSLYDGELQINIYNIQGQLVSNRIMPEFESITSFDISGFVSGLYLMRLNTSAGSRTLKFIKQ